MSKRGQPTGLPKESPKQSAAGERAAQGKLSRSYHSRAEREQQIQRWVILATGITVAIVVIVLAIAVIVDGIIVPNQVVAKVDGKDITVGQFQRRVRFERVLRDLQLRQVIQTYQSFGFPDSDILQQLQSQEPYATWIRELQAGDQLGLTVINQMVEDQLIRNAAAEQGISVTQADIDKQISEFFNYDPEALAEVTPEATAEGTEEPTATPTLTPTPFVSPTPSPTATITPTPEFTPTASPSPFPTVPPEPTLTTTEQAEQYRVNRDEFFATLRRQAGLSDADINAFYETQALRDALRDSITTDITETGPFVDARHILVNTLEEAQDVLAALQMGESFADLARAVSQDTGSGSSGGELGWNPVSQYVKPFGDAILASTELGEIIGPVETELGFHIIQVRAREDRELSEAELESAKENAFGAWLEDYKASKESVTETLSIWTNYIPDGPPTLFSQ